MGASWIEVVTNRLTIQGFVLLDFMFPKDGSNRVATEAFPSIAGALERGDITLDGTEDIVEVPFVDVPKVWGRLFTGASTGKLVTKLASKDDENKRIYIYNIDEHKNRVFIEV
jgi:NADPH-dependent curcumin reductase CurA